MSKLRRLLSSGCLAALLASSATFSSAQANDNNVESLGQMPCQEVEDLNYKTLNRDISIGYEIFRAVGSVNHWSNSSSGLLYSNEKGAVVCRLAGAGQRPTYRTLNLAFGLSDDNSRARASVVRLSIYLDGNFYQYQDVTRGRKYIWPIDVTDTRSVAIEAECIRGDRSGSRSRCAELMIFEDSLE